MGNEKFGKPIGFDSEDMKLHISGSSNLADAIAGALKVAEEDDEPPGHLTSPRMMFDMIRDRDAGIEPPLEVKRAWRIATRMAQEERHCAICLTEEVTATTAIVADRCTHCVNGKRVNLPLPLCERDEFLVQDRERIGSTEHILDRVRQAALKSMEQFIERNGMPVTMRQGFRERAKQEIESVLLPGIKVTLAHVRPIYELGDD